VKVKDGGWSDFTQLNLLYVLCAIDATQVISRAFCGISSFSLF
jgi:hypothetical protein